MVAWAHVMHSLLSAKETRVYCWILKSFSRDDVVSWMEWLLYLLNPQLEIPHFNPKVSINTLKSQTLWMSVIFSKIEISISGITFGRITNVSVYLS